MSTRGGLLSFGSPAASLRVRDVGGPARRRDSGLGSDVLLFMLIISASHPGSSDAGAGNPSPASWGRGNRAPGAWTALRHSGWSPSFWGGSRHRPSRPPPPAGLPLTPSPPVIRRRFKSPLGQGGIQMLSRRWRAKRAPPWTAGASGQVDRSRKAEGLAGQEAREATGAHAVSAKAGCTCGPAARRAAAPFRLCPAALSRGTQGALTGRPPPCEAHMFSASALCVPAWAGFRSS